MNILAVVVAAAVSFGIGSLWYSPLLFGNQWAELAGLKMDNIDKNQMIKGMMGSVVGALITSFILNHILMVLEVSSVAFAIKVSLGIWLGFIATTTINVVLYEQKPVKLFLINNAGSAVSLIAMATVLVLLG
jgi:hypothetical protein